MIRQMAAISLTGCAFAMALTGCAGEGAAPAGQQQAGLGGGKGAITADHAQQGVHQNGVPGGGGAPVPQQPAGGGTPCWAGNWLSQNETAVLQAPGGVTAPVQGGAGAHVTMQSNGVMQQDFSHAGALNGYETAPGYGQTPVSILYHGTELDQVSGGTGSSGTLTVKVEVPAQFTTVSGDVTTTQDDAVGSVSTMQYTCSGNQLVLTTPTGRITYLRVDF